MAINNPAFRDPAFKQDAAVAPTMTAQQLEELYNRPAAEQQIPQQPVIGEPAGGAITLEDTVVKSAISFGLLLVGAAVGWFTAESLPFLWIGAAMVGLVLALVNIFKKQPSPALILAYAGVQGVFIGGISAWYESINPGIVAQAVLATLCVVGVTLALFATGIVKASKRLTKIFFVAMIGYLLFSLINVVLMVTGANTDPWGLRGSVEIFGIPLGVVLGVFVVLMGAYSLVLDFDFVQRAVRNKAPKNLAWTAAFGIMVTVIWLYLEILRLLAISRN